MREARGRRICLPGRCTIDEAEGDRGLAITHFVGQIPLHILRLSAVAARSQWYQIIALHTISGIFTITRFILSLGELSAHAPNKTCAICQQLVQFVQ